MRWGDKQYEFVVEMRELTPTVTIFDSARIWVTCRYCAAIEALPKQLRPVAFFQQRLRYTFLRHPILPSAKPQNMFGRLRVTVHLASSC